MSPDGAWHRQSQCDFHFHSRSSVVQYGQSSQHRESPRQSRKKGATEKLLEVTVIYCDFEWLYMEWSINPIIQFKLRLIHHNLKRDNMLTHNYDVTVVYLNDIDSSFGFATTKKCPVSVHTSAVFHSKTFWIRFSAEVTRNVTSLLGTFINL
jgi:hypothetical protein